MMIDRLFPKAYKRYRSLPVLGSILDGFAASSCQRGFAPGTVRNQVKHARQIDRFLQQCGVRRLSDVSPHALQEAHEYFYPRFPSIAATARHLEHFIDQTHGLETPSPKPSTPIDVELDRYANYLSQVRGLVSTTIHSHCRSVKEFLEDFGFGENGRALAELTTKGVDNFLCQCGHRFNRHSLQHVVAYLRSFLRFQYEQGGLSTPLHTMIDTPRVYRFEQLPRHLVWETVEALLNSIDRSDAHGIRDYTMLFLIATYGLRACEIVSLTLDDIDWRAGTIRIRQRKTGNSLILPLTNTVAKILIQYLKKSRPNLLYRHLFLRVRAPHGLLKATAVTEVFQRRVSLSGLDIPHQGSHCLRHSYAVHLLRQGESTKVIGDLLGHHSAESTCVYLRLAIEDLRSVALPVPSVERVDDLGMIRPITSRRGAGKRGVPASVSRTVSDTLRSSLANDIQDYLQMKWSLGRTYAVGTATLRALDAFLADFYPTARKMTGEIFGRWSGTLSHLTPTVRRGRMQIVRSFCLYCRRSKPENFVPDDLTFPPNHPRPMPYIFPEHEVARLIAATQSLPPDRDSPLRAQTIRLAIILLYTTGLRRGELLRLKLSDFDASQATLRIDCTKFHKSRIIPLSPSVVEEVTTYLLLRRQTGLVMGATSALIWNRRGGPEGKSYSGTSLQSIWHALCSALRILTPEDKPPRIHDLRHSFAVNVLQRWYQTAQHVQAKLPLLSTYMGHVSIVSTHYYLPFVEGIRSEASARFHRNFGRGLGEYAAQRPLAGMQEGGVS